LRKERLKREVGGIAQLPTVKASSDKQRYGTVLSVGLQTADSEGKQRYGTVLSVGLQTADAGRALPSVMEII